MSRTLARLMGGDVIYGRKEGRSMFVLRLPARNEPRFAIQLAGMTSAGDGA